MQTFCNYKVSSNFERATPVLLTQGF